MLSPLLFLFLFPSTHASGVTLSPCLTTTDCLTPRTCIQSSTRLPPSTPCPTNLTNPNCICLPPSLQPCISNTDCIPTETCTHLNSSTVRHCASADLFPPTPTPLPPPLRLSGTFCISNSSCAPHYHCHRVRFSPQDPLPLLRGPCTHPHDWQHTCMCFPEKGLHTHCNRPNSKCPPGEACLAKQYPTTTPFCATPTGTLFEALHNRIQPLPSINAPSAQPDQQQDSHPNPIPTAGRCVAVHHLRGIAPHLLLYAPARPVWARVLCDWHGSCATPGHMVVWHTHPMMMHTYCRMYAHKGCEETVMQVNSPRWAKHLRVHSLSPGLAFTPFAARFASTLEEFALATVLRAGW